MRSVTVAVVVVPAIEAVVVSSGTVVVVVMLVGVVLSVKMFAQTLDEYLMHADSRPKKENTERNTQMKPHTRCNSHYIITNFTTKLLKALLDFSVHPSPSHLSTL